MTTMTLRIGGFSTRLPTRLVLVNAVLVILLVAFAGQSLLAGTYPTSLADLQNALSGRADRITSMILLDHRLPRILTAIGVGLAFGLAGETIQTLLKNPLASPDIIGFSAGAGTGAVLTVVLFGTGTFVFFGAMLGGLTVAALILALSWKRGIAPAQLVLMGIGISLTVSVINDLLMTRFDVTEAAQIAKWLVGSLEARHWQDVAILWLGLACLGPLAFWFQFKLSRLALGDETATVLGVAGDPARMTTLLLAIGLVALAVSVAGPLPFVAFVSGPIAHGLTRQPRPTLLCAALVGALVTLLADTASQSLPGGLTLPAGIFTALIGAPVLLWCLIVESRKRRG